jgi:hypothetical protein
LSQHHFFLTDTDRITRVYDYSAREVYAFRGSFKSFHYGRDFILFVHTNDTGKLFLKEGAYTLPNITKVDSSFASGKRRISVTYDGGETWFGDSD